MNSYQSDGVLLGTMMATNLSKAVTVLIASVSI